MSVQAASAEQPRFRAALGWSRWSGAGLDLLFPPECASCGAAQPSSSEGLLCRTCVTALLDGRPACGRCGLPIAAAATTAVCSRCQQQKFAFDAVVRLGKYDGVLRHALLRIKRAHERGLAAALGELLAAARGDSLVDWRADAVLPVPMHWSRRMWRGANSAHTLAQRLARRLGLPLADHLLVRRRRTVPQASLSTHKRRANVRRAFRVRPHQDLHGARLLLVDDVMTTGATVNEAARTLRRAGAAAVAVVVLARAEGLV